ncbi:MAG: methyltransferase [Terriglobia bacterium]
MIEGDGLWQSWTHLTEVVRSGQPIHPHAGHQAAEEFFPTLVRSLHITNREPARKLALALEVAVKGPLNVLDVACGSGVWSIAVAEANSQARVAALDFPKVLELTQQFAASHGVGDRFEYLAGDLRSADLGENRFDLALLGNICHSAGEHASRDLLRRLHRALRAGGWLVIIDTIPDDERSGPVFPLIFALNMLLNTEEGDVYTLAEYRQWLSEAGFARADTTSI